MKITKQQFELLQIPSEEISSMLKEKCLNVNSDDNNYAERGELDFESNGFSYSLIEYDEDDISDEGKYQYGSTTYQLVEFDSKICSYPNELSTIKEFNLFVRVNFSRSGSYFSDWYYSYEIPEILIVEVKHIERQVIEEHDVFTFVSGEIDDRTVEDSDMSSWDEEEWN